MERREFLKTAGAGLAAAVLGARGHSASGATARPRGGAGGAELALELQGQFAGRLKSVENTQVSAAQADTVAGHTVQQSAGNTTQGDITLTCAAGMSRVFYDWIRESVDRRAAARDGAVVVADYNMRETYRLEFHGAQLAEVGFPPLSAASKDAAYMKVKILPAMTHVVIPTGVTLAVPTAVQRRPWLQSNFRLQIDGLSDACRYVSTVEPITVQPLNSRQAPNLAVALPAAHAGAFTQWQQAMTGKENRFAAQKKNGVLEYLAPDLQTVLFALTFHNLGIVRMTTGIQAGAIPRVRVEMSCEGLSFEYKAGALA